MIEGHPGNHESQSRQGLTLMWKEVGTGRQAADRCHRVIPDGMTTHDCELDEGHYGPHEAQSEDLGAVMWTETLQNFPSAQGTCMAVFSQEAFCLLPQSHDGDHRSEVNQTVVWWSRTSPLHAFRIGLIGALSDQELLSRVWAAAEYGDGRKYLTQLLRSVCK